MCDHQCETAKYQGGFLALECDDCGHVTEPRCICGDCSARAVVQDDDGSALCLTHALRFGELDAADRRDGALPVVSMLELWAGKVGGGLTPEQAALEVRAELYSSAVFASIGDALRMAYRLAGAR